MKSLMFSQWGVLQGKEYFLLENRYTWKKLQISLKAKQKYALLQM